jgi:fatty-acyl-CoA synthase
LTPERSFRECSAHVSTIPPKPERQPTTSGRAKLVIKPKGYQVFPEDLESHIHEKLKDRAGMVAIVGVEHEVFSEGIMAFVECQEGKTITPAEVLAACGDISASLQRIPQYVEVLPNIEAKQIISYFSAVLSC